MVRNSLESTGCLLTCYEPVKWLFKKCGVWRPSYMLFIIDLSLTQVPHCPRVIWTFWYTESIAIDTTSDCCLLRGLAFYETGSQTREHLSSAQRWEVSEAPHLNFVEGSMITLHPWDNTSYVPLGVFESPMFHKWGWKSGKFCRAPNNCPTC